MSEKNKFNETMLLPKTNFGMRGKLPTEEIKMMEFWKEINLWNIKMTPQKRCRKTSGRTKI